MTSLSRIIRSIHYNQQQEEKKEITIRPMFQPETFGESLEVVETPHVPTLEEVLAERNQLLREANAKIEAERAQFAEHVEAQQQQLAEAQQAFEESLPGIQQEAYDSGFQQGYEEGTLKAQADLAEALATANATIAQAQQNALQYIEEQEALILELALKSAEQIIGTVLQRDDAAFLTIIEKALKEAREMKSIKIYVAPEYYELVSNNRSDLMTMFPPDVPFLIFVNEDLAATESYIETNHGRIVVSIDVQLQELRKALNELLHSKE